MISIVLRGGGRPSFLSVQGFTGGSDPEKSHPELVSGSNLAWYNKPLQFPLPLADLRTDGVSESEQIRIASRLSRQEHAPQAKFWERGANPRQERVRVRGKDNYPLPMGEGGRSPGEGISLSCKFGFTLAEVLITLGIIGIVAAMTLPSLVQKNVEKQRVSQLKKAYSTLSQAYLTIHSVEGSPDEWNLPDRNAEDGGQYVLNKFKPYLRILKDCGTRGKGCYSEGPSDTQGNTAAKVVLYDGSALSVKVWDAYCTADYGNSKSLKSVCGILEVDLNGLKSPNLHGHDIFRFFLTKQAIVPYGTTLQSGNEDVSNNVSWAYCLNNNGRGGGCTAWVLYNENMDYLHCKDLSWTGKTKCK